MRTLLLSPAMRATLRAYPATLPGVTGAPRLAARVRFARGTLPPPVRCDDCGVWHNLTPTCATVAAMADVRALVASHALTADMVDALADLRSLASTHAYVMDAAGRPLLPPAMTDIGVRSYTEYADDMRLIRDRARARMVTR